MRNILDLNKEELQKYLLEHPDKINELYTQEYVDKLHWEYIDVNLLNPSVNWKSIIINLHLSEEFINAHAHIIDWLYVSEYQKLSESFIEAHADKVYWEAICTYQKLSEDFIEKHKEFVDWKYISKYQELSEEFISSHKNSVDWLNISMFQKLSPKFIKKYEQFLNPFVIVDNWLSRSTEFKKKEVTDTGLYECYNDYFIAYKGIRHSRYSKFNFQYQYLPGETYECFADGSRCDYSFGLSVWTEEEARRYCDELIVKCKIRYEDVARVLEKGKIRCSKIEILD